MSQLDKFKRRLIRSVARLRVEEKKPEAEVWEILGKEMGCDCGPLWDRMRALTVKKLARLLACEDRTELIANVARPSDTDMLMFDQVLAHEEDVDVIGRDVILEKATDFKALQELFELVQEFSLEETDAAALPHTWAEAACYYESRGNRLTSPMLLQRRWYQFKELTRANFYKLWQIYRGNTSLWDKARKDCSLTDLQVAVAERYPFLITKPFQKWDQLIKDGRIVLSQHFTRTGPEKSDAATSGNEQDLVLLEPEVETIDLDEDFASETEHESRQGDSTVQPNLKLLNRTDEGKTATIVEYNPNITIKTEPTDSDGLCNVKILEATHIPVETLDKNSQETIKTEDIDPRIALKNDLLRNISQCIESTDDLIKQCDPQEDQTENVLNALNDVENQMENIIKPRLSAEVIEDAPEPQTSNHNTDEDIYDKAVDYIRNKIVEEISKPSNDEATGNTVKGGVRTDDELKSNVPEDNMENSLSSEKVNTADDVRSSEEDDEEVLEDIIKQTADDFVNKSNQSREESGAMTLTDLTIIDGGIDFVDDGIEYMEHEEGTKMDIDAGNSSSTGAETKQDITQIDLKLLMTPVIVTTRLDDMLAFKDKTFESVVERSIIDFAEQESKPKQSVTEPVKELQIKQENISEEPVMKLQVEEENKSNADDSNSDTSDSENDVISDDQRVKPTSYLLQKPKSRIYNPIQLCKNPDFNTRLKRLTFGFLSSERNRQFLSACKPATVDLHKAFEVKLVNGTLYLNQSVTTDIVKKSIVQKDDQSVRTVSVVPSAMSVQSLIDRSKMNFQPPSKVSSIDLTSDDVIERNKVIHLPDITQVRRINQKLLTAEVPPTRMQNNVTTEEISSYLEVHPVVESTTENTTGIRDAVSNSDSTGQVITKTSPLLSNLLVTHKPPSFPKSYVSKLLAEIPSKDPYIKVPGKRIRMPPKMPDKPPAVPGKPPAVPGKPPAVPGKPPAVPGKPPAVPGKPPAVPGKPPAVPGKPPAVPGKPPAVLGKPPAVPGKPPAMPYKPPSDKHRKPRAFCPYLSWNKPSVMKNIPLDDFLLTHDTLLKILARAKNLPDFTYSIGNKNTVNVYKSSQKCFPKTKDTKTKQKVSDNQKSRQLETNKIEVTEDQKNTQKITKGKQRVRAKKGIMKTICCWARAWVFKSKGQLVRLPKHMCPFPECNCCCKDELPLSESKEIVENNVPIELSDDESVTNLTSVSKIIECVVQQSVQVPVPKLRVFSTTKPQQNLNKEATDLTLCPTDVQKNAPTGNIVLESLHECSQIESSIVDNILQDVVIDDDSIAVADVQGEISVVADDIVQNNSVNVDTPMEKPRKIYIIPEANAELNANNCKSNIKPNSQVDSTANQKIKAQINLDLSRPTTPLVSSSVSKKMYVKSVYSKPSQKPPSVSMSTQTMGVPLLQNLSIERKVESVSKSDVMLHKQLVIDGTRPFTTPTTIVNKKYEQVIHLKASKVSSDSPIFLGKNKILLTTVKFPSNTEFPNKENKENAVASKVAPCFSLPDGVEIVLQPNGELGCMMKPGVELDSTQISMLPYILESVKQQIDIQQPLVLSDVINLSDDENDQKNEKNENVSQARQQNYLMTAVERTQELDTLPGKQLVEDTEKTQRSGEDLLIEKKHVTAVSKVCNSFPESHTDKTEREDDSEYQKNNQKETSICQLLDRDTLKSRMCDDNLAKSDENGDDHQTYIEKNTTLIQTENNKCEEDKLMDNINSSKDTEPEQQETQETSEPSAGSRNLLSDLMEMSGISEEDMKIAPEVNTPTFPAVINIDKVNIANKMNADGSFINQFPDLTPVSSIAQLKYACEQGGKFFKLDFDTGTLVPISVCIKKKGFAYDKLQTDTVEFAVKETGASDNVDIAFNTKVGIPANRNADIPTISSTSVERKQSILLRRFERNEKSISVRRFDGNEKSIFVSKFERNKKTPAFSKPITILRHTRPQSLLHNQLQAKRTFKRPRKATGGKIEAKIDLVDSDAPMEEEYLINSESDDDDMSGTSDVPRDRIAYRQLAASNTITEISDDSSDDEPLALKSKRMRLDLPVPAQVVTETVNNLNEEHEKNVQEFLRSRARNEVNVIVEREIRRPETELTDVDSMELDTDMLTAAILEEPVPEPEEGDSFESESSPEDSILGM